MGKLLMRGYWVLIICVGVLYGVLAAFTAGFILLPLILGVMQRSIRKEILVRDEMEADNVQLKDGINTITLSGDLNDMINPLAITSSKL